MKTVIVRSYLEAMDAFAKRQKFSIPTMEQFVLKHGMEFAPHSTMCILRGRVKECFKNASLLARESGGNLIYCEGFAVSIIPTLHAWCVTRKGEVFEPTWKELGTYYGIPFKLSFVLKTICKRGVYGIIDDWERRWPLIRNTPPETEWKEIIECPQHN